MIQCQDFIKLIEYYAPLSAAAAWDNSGWQVMGQKQKIKRVAVSLDPSLAQIDACLAFNADFILCHHPLYFEPQSLSQNNSYTQTVRKLMQANVHLYSAHTSLDANPKGPVRWLANELALENITILEPNPTSHFEQNNEPQAKLPEYGFGYLGNLPAPLNKEVFFQKLKNLLPAGHWNVCGKVPQTVTKIACCPGSGSTMWAAAQKKGANILITGDLKYHTALDAEAADFTILDVGHFSLEEEMMRRLALELAKKASGVEVKFFPSQDPIYNITI